MGANQSARKLTINNEDGVIQISTELVQRLTHSNNNNTSEIAPSSSSLADVAGEVNTAESYKNDSNEQSQPNFITPPPIKSVPHQQYPVQVHPEYTVTAYKMQQQKEMELEAQDQYWQKRLYNLKLANERITKIFQDEYKKAFDEIINAQGKKNINLDSVVPPCGADKEKVLQCYQENPREILKCASVVDEFYNCVDQRRANIIAARC